VGKFVGQMPEDHRSAMLDNGHRGQPWVVLAMGGDEEVLAMRNAIWL
jgi:hypothetical protein